MRESTQSWHELLVEAKSRGLKIAPEIAVADGALGFWKGARRDLPRLSDAGCTKSKYLEQGRTVGAGQHEEGLREVYLAPNRASAEVAIDVFAEKYAAKYDKAVECLTKDRDAMLAFYDFQPSIGSLANEFHRKRVRDGLT